ncbi:phosphoenolpyruvate--protein phosphotransferase [Parashewanella spongiae]|uniref:Phosphoenolpyruvate-protein phosphotransferase n=1 Tax=Parashewanella spongiae TaxID=342950 RepID=A0A3A6TJB4_9GAMM|nr:phosphoenolpyruvate--protein phosphotransferase [Parashewanella spongiae]MCL1079547.1 phosphoenolpyruvate--protein phosphotransferase [Parashewanella spongiae]RJY07379.1 phosphoenolpyruvate--protein phosphotransferase [Parashewanella spongiae]
MSLAGVAVSSGVAFGQAVHLIEQDCSVDFHLLPKSEIKPEKQRLTQAVKELISILETGQNGLEIDSENFQLIDADILLLQDEDLLNDMLIAIENQRFSASLAVDRIFDFQASEIEALNDPILASRAYDIRCLSNRLIASINGTLTWDLSHLRQASILFAKDITPAEFAMLPQQNISGIILETGGLTSHTAILARAAGIPALFNCSYQELSIRNGQTVILDAISGVLHAKPSQELQSALRLKQLNESERLQQLLTFKDKEAITQDGHKVALYANVGNLSEITRTTELGAQGVGLFRTEFMLMNATEYPNEQNQFLLYCDALHVLDGCPLTIRTLDIGADKDLPFEHHAHEENPALGIRGCRYTLAHPELLKPQLKAALRAANHGSIRLMFPMINQIEELDSILQEIEICKQELVSEEVGFGDFEIGLMIETPAAVMNINSLLPHLDFVSIGTNDLTQYTMAADRGNPQLTKAFPSLSPAILNLIKMTITAAKVFDVKVSLCGELASDKRAVAVLVGMGLEELSINLSSLLEIKSTICDGNYNNWQTLANSALKTSRVSELHELVCN